MDAHRHGQRPGGRPSRRDVGQWRRGGPVRDRGPGGPMTDGALGATRPRSITLRDPNATPAAVDAATISHPHPVGRGERPRRDQRCRRIAPRAVRARRPQRLRGRRHLDNALASSCRSRTLMVAPRAPSTELLRVRHEPRLVRPDPARDRRQAGGSPEVPAASCSSTPTSSLKDYFFPPNADPEYHETPDAAHAHQRRLQPGYRRAVPEGRREVLPRRAV